MRDFLNLLKLFFTIMMLFLCNIDCFADQVIVCEAPVGQRVDYFLNSNTKLKSKNFVVQKDEASGVKPTIILSDKSSDALTFILQDTNLMQKPETSATKMTIIENDGDQVSFVGKVMDAPVLATYYPKLSILIYSQQAYWGPLIGEGARAMIFYSKCAAPSQVKS